MTTINGNLFQALSLDLSILEVLLKRHRCSHGRAIYFRRMSMVLKATQRFHLLQTGEQLERFEQKAIEYCQEQKRKRHRSKNKNDDHHWDIRGGLDNEKSKILQTNYQALERLYTDSFAEILSRIDHASAPLFLEVSRGFFLPFCTVALGTLARVRTVILRIGRYGLSKLQELVSSDEELRKFLTFSKDVFEATIAKYLEGDKSSPTNKNSGVGMVSNRERRSNLMKSVGYCIPELSNSGADRSISEDAVFVSKRVEGIPPHNDDPHQDLLSTANQKTTPDLRSTTSQTAVQNDGDDIGESVTYSRVAGNHKGAKKGKDQSTTATAQIASMHDATEQLDRNMELVANFKNGKKGGDDKKSKKRNEKESVSDKKKEKKKKKRKVDFFDTLFD